jgi:hypothetical protein
MNEASPGRRSRVWVAAVAAVAALLLSGTVAVLNAGGHRFEAATPTVTVLGGDSPTVRKNMDLCWQTAKRLAGTVTYPDRATWRAVLGTQSNSASMTVIRANGQPLFCETSVSGVILSNPSGLPAYAPGTRTGVLLSTFYGNVAGVMDPSWQQVHITADIRYSERVTGKTTVRDGLFVYSTFTSLLGERARIGPTENPGLDLPNPPRQYGSASPEVIQGHRGGYDKSDQQLVNCVQSTTDAVPDENTWNPGATVSWGNTNLVIAVNGAGVSTCLLRAGKAEFKPYLTMQAYTPVPIALPMPALDGRTVIGGLVPPGVQRMTLTLPDRSVVKADVDHDTFAVLLPVGADPAPTSVLCELVGSSDQILYDGPLT